MTRDTTSGAAADAAPAANPVDDGFTCLICGGYADDGACPECGGDGTEIHYPLGGMGTGCEFLACDRCAGTGEIMICYGKCDCEIDPANTRRNEEAAS